MFGFGKTTKLKEYIAKLEAELRIHEVNMSYMKKAAQSYDFAIEKLHEKIEKLESKGESK